MIAPCGILDFPVCPAVLPVDTGGGVDGVEAGPHESVRVDCGNQVEFGGVEEEADLPPEKEDVTGP